MGEGPLLSSVRLLRPDEWGRVQELTPEYKFPLPEVAAIVIAESGQKIDGFAVVQPVFHCEPFWISPEHRGTGLSAELVPEIQKVVESDILPNTTYYCFSPFSRADELLASIGFEKQPWSVWKRGKE